MSTLLESKVDCIVPVPAPRLKKKLKLTVDCTTTNIVCNIHVKNVLPPARTKRKSRAVADIDYLNKNKNNGIFENLITSSVLDNSEYKIEHDVINYELTTNIKKEINEIKSVSPVKDVKAPKIVKLIEKCSLDHNETDITINSNSEIDINNVTKFKKNICSNELSAEFGNVQRDSEHDSGVFFSDSTKVSSSNPISDTDILQNINKENDYDNCTDDAFCNELQNQFVRNNDDDDNNDEIITIDRVDNNNETNVDSSVVNPLVSALDSFEAETLSMFKESALKECKNNLFEDYERPFIGESLNRYLADILNVTDSVEDVNNEIIDVVNLKLDCNESELNTKVYHDTVGGTCNDIFNCVGSDYQDHLGSSNITDYSSTNVCFVLNECGSSDVFNDSVIVNSTVNFIDVSNDSESSNRDSYTSYSDNNSPVNNTELIDDKQLFCDTHCKHNICFNNTHSLNSSEKLDNELYIYSDKDHIEDKVLIEHNCDNKVKSLISYFENIVLQKNDSNIQIDCDDQVPDVPDSYIKNIDEFVEEKQQNQCARTTKVIKKCVSFSDDIIIIDENSMNPILIQSEDNSTYKNKDTFSSLSSEDTIDESCKEFTYEKLSVSDDNSSELYSSISPERFIEETASDVFPLIDPPNEYRSTKTCDFRANNEICNVSLDSSESNSLSDLWSNKMNESDNVNDAQLLKRYCSFLGISSSNSDTIFSNLTSNSLTEIQNNGHANDYDLTNSNKVISEYKSGVKVKNNDGCVLETENNLEELAPTIPVNEFAIIVNKNEDQENNRMYEVSLSKTWGTIGIKLERDENTNQLFISDLLPGGAAESTGLITKGIFMVQSLHIFVIKTKETLSTTTQSKVAGNRISYITRFSILISCTFVILVQIGF